MERPVGFASSFSRSEATLCILLAKTQTLSTIMIKKIFFFFAKEECKTYHHHIELNKKKKIDIQTLNF
jgi:hypothetical protein